MGSNPPAARFAGARVRPDGGESNCLLGASLLDAIPDRQRHHPTPRSTAKAAGARRAARHLDSGDYVVLADAIAFQSRPASNHRAPANGTGPRRTVIRVV